MKTFVYLLMLAFGMTGFLPVAHAQSPGATSSGTTSSDAAPSRAEAEQKSRANESAQMHAIFDALADISGIEATFEEEKHLKLLALPMESEGTLYFHRDGYLLRKMRKPAASSVRITPKALVIEEHGESKRIALTSHKEVAHVVQSFMWILAGDLSSLRAHFSLDFETVAGLDDAPPTATKTALPKDWTLTLRPKNARVQAMIAKIVVSGGGRIVKEIRVEEHGGDLTITRVSDVDLTRTFSAEEMHTLFGRSR